MAENGKYKQIPQPFKSEETIRRAQEAQVEHTFPNSTAPIGIYSLPPGSRGPRSLYLKRTGDSFGFTLRHFIIYPPDILTESDGRHAAVGAISAPMETIFVRDVKSRSAQKAGLQRGDRIVGVNGHHVVNLPYQTVVNLIQNSPPYLQLLVVPKEDDILQKFFSDTAYNPVSNQSPILQPDYYHPNNGKRTAQKVVAQAIHNQPRRFQADVQSWKYLQNQVALRPVPPERGIKPQLLSHEIYTEIAPHEARQRQISRAQPQVPLYRKMGRRASEGNALPERNFYASNTESQDYISIDSDPGEMVVNPNINTMKTAYKATGYMSDSTSQGSADVSSMLGSYPNSAGCRASLDGGGRRESSSSLTSSYADGSKDSLYSMDSNSTLTGHETDNSSVIMSRYRKSFQQKEEFLRMPSSTSPEPTLIQREFYGRPKKLEKSMWPPPNEVESPTRTVNNKPTHHNFQRVKNEIDTERDYVGPNQPSSLGTLPQQRGVKSPKGNHSGLGNIQEGSMAPTDFGHPDEMNGAYGACEGEDKRVYSPTTQLVQQRAKAFESGKPLPEDDPALSDRTSFYKSELARISSKQVVPNVTERAQEYEIRANEPRRDNSSNSLPRRIHRDSRSLDSSDSASYELTSVGLPRSNSAESWVVVSQEKDQKGEEPPVVKLRIKNTNLGDDDRVTRRESYLKATESSRLPFGNELSDGEVSPNVLRSGSASGSSSNASLDRDKERYNIIKEGCLHCKIMEIDGKRSGDRSWKQVWVVLRGPKLYIYKEVSHKSPIGTAELVVEPSLGSGVDIRSSLVRVAEDYTKRKHVLRVSSVNPCRSEVLLQADNAEDLADWVKVLNDQVPTATTEESNPNVAKQQQAVPQANPAQTSIQVQGSRLLPNKKTTSTRNRSPTGQSPVSKTRKPSQIPDIATSPKTKTWRGKVVRQLKKIHGGSSPSSPTAPEGSTFGVPLEHCLASSRNPYVPKIVEVCTDIVEERGLQTVGIYRVPGNNAMITSLTEEINKNYHDIPLDDTRWQDIHVVSSILKSFFRKLPDSLVTTALYECFMKADKIENDPQARMEELKRLIKSLPPHNYHTLKHLILHLCKVVQYSDENKMKAKNVAIMFGPNIVRQEEETMQSMVSNMNHHCKIMETLLLYADWFFSDNESATLNIRLMENFDDCEMATNQQALIDALTTTQKEKNGAILSTIISAAQRKIHKKKPNSADKELSSPNGSNCNTTINSIEYSSSDFKEVTMDHKNRIPTTVMDLEKCNKPEKMPWFNYSTDKEEFHKRITDFEKETKAMLTMPRNLEISVSSLGSRQTSNASMNVQQISTRLSVQSDPNLLQKTHSASNVFPEHLKQSLINKSTTIENRNSLDSSYAVRYNHNTSSAKSINNNNGGVRHGVPQGLYYGPVSDNDGLRIGTDYVDGGDRWNAKYSLRKGSSAENINMSTTDLTNNGTMKKIKYENQNENQRTGSLDSLNKIPGPEDDADLVTTMTKLYDEKLKKEHTQKSLLTGEGLPFVDASPEKIPPEKINKNTSNKENIPHSGNNLYRNPSLHKFSISNKEKKDRDEDMTDQEKDEDSTMTIEIPDNNKFISNNSQVLGNKLTIFNSNKLSSDHKLKRSESLNKPERNVSPLKLKRSESLNKAENRVKRSDSLSKYEKTESNISKKRELLTSSVRRKDSKLKRKNGMPDRSIKRRHTVGGTKDPDKVTWLGKYNDENETQKENKRTSSPDLSSTRRERFLFEINLIGPENMVVSLRHHIGGRPQSFPETSVFSVPLESHV